MTVTQRTYIIIGGSAAGMAAAQAIRRQDPHGTVTVLSEEPDRPYFRPLIPFLVSGKKQASDMALEGSGPYTGRDITVRTHARVEAVDTAEKAVSLAGGDRLTYDRVLFATGSRAHVPPEIRGTDAAGVFALRTLAHARDMAERAGHADHAVMLGGGLLNLKAAFALLERGIKVTLVVYSPEVLSRLMEPGDANLIRKALDQAGLRIRTGCSATAILSDDSGVTAVALDDGREMACQMVCIGKGVRPSVDFLTNTDVRIDRGIVTDRYTACAVADTFAAGDVAVTFDPVSGDRVMTALWTNAVEMGRCAGLNMAGVRTAYTGTSGILNATQVADMPFVSMGVVHTEDSGFEVYTHATETTYRKVVFDETGTRLIGALFIGDITNAGLYRTVMREKMGVEHIKRTIIDHRLHYGHFLARGR